MRPIQLSMQAFGPYVGRQDLDFTEGLAGESFFLIHGATGAGKTTILDAICFALYGKASGQDRTGTMMRAGLADAKTETFVEFTFALGPKTYRIYRRPAYRRLGYKSDTTAKAELWQLGVGEPKLLASRYTDVSEYVATLLGFECEQFRQVVLLPQGEFRRFLTANSQQRGAILQALFQTDHYRRIEEKLGERAGDLSSRVNKCREKKEQQLAEAGVSTTEELDETIRAREDERKTLALDVAAKQDLRQRKNNELQQGRELDGHFRRYAEQQRIYAEHLAKLPTQQEFAAHLERAQKAAALQDKDLQARRDAKMLSERSQTVTLREKASKEADAAAKTAEAAFAAEEARAGERQKAEANCQELARYAELLDGIASLRTETEAAVQYAASLTSKAQKAAETAADLQQKQETLRTQERELLRSSAGAAGLEQRRSRLTRELEQQRELSVLTAKIASVTDVYRKAASQSERDKEKAVEARKYFLRLQELFRDGQAAHLAATLADGKPCPVCGAVHHPHPAVGELTVSETELDAAEKTADRAAERANASAVSAAEQAQSLRQLREDEAAKRKVAVETYTLRLREEAGNGENDASTENGETSTVKAGGVSSADGNISEAGANESVSDVKDLPSEETLQAELAGVNAAIRDLSNRQRQAATIGQKLQRIAVSLRRAEEDEKRLRDAAQEAERKSQRLQATLDEKSRQIPDAYAEKSALQRAIRAAETLVAELTRKHRQAAELRQKTGETAAAARTAFLQAQQEEMSAAKRAAESRDTFLNAVKTAGFADEAEYREIIGGNWGNESYRDIVAKRIQAFQQEMRDAKKACADEESILKDKTKPDLAALEQAAVSADQAWQDALKRQVTCQEEQKNLAKRRKAVEKLDKETAELEERHQVIGRLAEVANAVSPYRIHFQTYIQQSIFGDVMEAANQRLTAMSGGRYHLQPGGKADARGWQGLELEVFDEYSGQPRETKSLSGGESFLASLALALGLADIVQQYAGGVRLDTVFIDEGFGTLDSETLDTAIETLVNLQQGGNRLVGIISHVEELRQRIPVRLEVTKTPKGSRAEFVRGRGEE